MAASASPRWCAVGRTSSHEPRARATLPKSLPSAMRPMTSKGCGTNGVRCSTALRRVALDSDCQGGRRPARSSLTARTHDRLTSDAGVGSATQKSINLELASIREILDRPNTSVRWTDGANMLSDVLTKDMPADHLRETLSRGTWAIEFVEEYVKTSRRVARQQWEKKMAELRAKGDGAVMVPFGLPEEEDFNNLSC